MVPPSSPLAASVRAHLQQVAARAETITYQTLAAALQLQPPNTIHQLTIALEVVMAEDAAANQPFIAALVVSKQPPYLPRAGFFQRATELGRFSGTDADAPSFHARELAAAREYWSRIDVARADSFRTE